MNNERLGALLEKRFEVIDGRPGFWVIPVADKPGGADRPAPEGNGEAPDNRDPFDEGPDGGEEGEPKEEGKVVNLMVITDETADRMRIMVPIREFDPKDEDERKLAVLLLHANFDRALDAKYAINGGVLWSCFVHPLSTLTEADLDNALKQVQTLRANTGTSYSSTELFFGGGAGGQEELEDEDPPEERPET